MFNLNLLEVSFLEGSISSIGNGTRIVVPMEMTELKLHADKEEKIVSAQVVIKRDGDRIRYRIFLHEEVHDA